jgi:hypothetical protein
MFVINRSGRDIIAHAAPDPQALAQLRFIRGDLLCARVVALQLDLSDARSRELAEKIADALTLVGRLIAGNNP